MNTATLIHINLKKNRLFFLSLKKKIKNEFYKKNFDVYATFTENIWKKIKIKKKMKETFSCISFFLERFKGFLFVFFSTTKNNNTTLGPV